MSESLLRRGAALLSTAVCTLGVAATLLAVAPSAEASYGDPTANRIGFDYFLSRGLTPVQSAGVIGNLDQESGMDPAAVQGDGPGRGIAQWSAGARWDTTASDNVAAFAAASGESRWSLGAQLDFLWFELTAFSHNGLAQLRAATTVDAAVTAFQDNFEVCGACDTPHRVAYADAVYSAANGDAAPNTRAGTVVGAGALSHVFVTTTHGSVSQRFGSGSSFAWDDIGGTVLTGSPAVLYAEPSNQYSVFATGSDDFLYEKDYANGAWGASWRRLGTYRFRPGVAAVVDRFGVRHVFATGLNGSVYNIRNSSGSTWSFDNIGGTVLTGTPGVTYDAARNSYSVYATGTDGTLYTKGYASGSWATSWSAVGGTRFTRGVSAVVDVYGHTQLFAVGADHALYEIRNSSGNSWTFYNLGGTVLNGTPKVIYGPLLGRFDVFTAGTDGRLWHKAYENGAWWSSFHDFGGSTVAG